MLNLQLADHTADAWATAFNEAAPAILGGVSAGELKQLGEAGDPRHDATFRGANFRLWTAKLKVGLVVVGGWVVGGWFSGFRTGAPGASFGGFWGLQRALISASFGGLERALLSASFAG